jgi:hypothetical protein
MLLRQFAETGAAFDFGFQAVTLLFGFDQNMTCAGSCHDFSPLF